MLFDKDPTTAARKGSRQKKKKQRADGDEPSAAIENLVEIRTSSNRGVWLHCERCNGRKLPSGRLVGGFLPVVWVTPEGRILEAVAACSCRIGRLLKGRFENWSGRKMRDYDELISRGIASSKIRTFEEAWAWSVAMLDHMAQSVGREEQRPFGKRDAVVVLEQLGFDLSKLMDEDVDARPGE